MYMYGIANIFSCHGGRHHIRPAARRGSDSVLTFWKPFWPLGHVENPLGAGKSFDTYASPAGCRA